MAEQVMQPSRSITRREFLNYVWGAAFTLFLAQFGIGVYLFALPRFREGGFGSDIDLGVVGQTLPPPDSLPIGYPDVKTWLIHIGPQEAAKGQGIPGLLAIYKVCTHLGCLYKAEPSTVRFECPCHGSKFQFDGTYIEGPAPRDLDRFVVQLVDAEGKVVAQTDEDPDSPAYGAPFALPANADNLRIVVKTGERINLGKRHFYKDKA